MEFRLGRFLTGLLSSRQALVAVHDRRNPVPYVAVAKVPPLALGVAVTPVGAVLWP